MTPKVSRPIVGPRIVDDALYLRRAADDLLDERIRSRRWAALIGPSRQGKTSALERARRLLERDGVGVAYLSFKELVPRANLEWWERILRTIRRNIPEVSDVSTGAPPAKEDDVREWLIGLLRGLAQAASKRSITLLLDEFGELANLPSTYVTEILAALDVVRQEEDGQGRLMLLIAGLIDPRDLGERSGLFGIEQVHLGEFSWVELLPLRELLEAKLGQGDAWIRAILDWTGGHPFFTQWCCHELLNGSSDDDVKSPEGVVEAIVQRGILGEDGGVGHAQIVEMGTEFQRRVSRVRDRMELLDTYRTLLDGNDALLDWEEPAHRWLRVLGFVRFDRLGGVERMRVRNRLIERYYDLVWVRKEYAALDRPFAQDVTNWRNDPAKVGVRQLTLDAVQKRIEWFESQRPEISRREEQYLLALREEVERQRALRRRMLIGVSLVLAAIMVAYGRSYLEDRTRLAAADALSRGRLEGAVQALASIGDAGVSQGIENVIVTVMNCKRDLESPIDSQSDRLVYTKSQIRAITEYLDGMDSALSQIRIRAGAVSAAFEVCRRDLSVDRATIVQERDQARREQTRLNDDLDASQTVRANDRESARRTLNAVTAERDRFQGLSTFYESEVIRLNGIVTSCRLDTQRLGEQIEQIREAHRREIEQERRRLQGEITALRSALQAVQSRPVQTPTPDAGAAPTPATPAPEDPQPADGPRDS